MIQRKLFKLINQPDIDLMQSSILECIRYLDEFLVGTKDVQMRVTTDTGNKRVYEVVSETQQASVQETSAMDSETQQTSAQDIITLPGYILFFHPDIRHALLDFILNENVLKITSLMENLSEKLEQITPPSIKSAFSKNKLYHPLEEICINTFMHEQDSQDTPTYEFKTCKELIADLKKLMEPSKQTKKDGIIQAITHIAMIPMSMTLSSTRLTMHTLKATINIAWIAAKMTGDLFGVLSVAYRKPVLAIINKTLDTQSDAHKFITQFLTRNADEGPVKNVKDIIVGLQDIAVEAAHRGISIAADTLVLISNVLLHLSVACKKTIDVTGLLPKVNVLVNKLIPNADNSPKPC